MSKARPMDVPFALHAARCELMRRGFWLVSTNKDRTSFYLRLKGTAFDLRLSSHDRTLKHRRDYPNVVHSWVIKEPMTFREIEESVVSVMAMFSNNALARSA